MAYLIGGLVWIYSSDYLVFALFGESDVAVAIGTIKDMLFVAVTAALFYLTLKSRLKSSQATLASHYEYITKYANDIFVLIELAAPNRIVEINDNVPAVYGYTKSEMIGMPIKNLRAEAARSTIEHDLGQYTTQNSSRLYETLHQRKDGSVFPVEVSGRIVEIGGRKYLQAVMRDITERKRNETALIASRRRTLALLDSLPDAAWMMDHGDRYIAANQAMANDLGVNIKDIIGKTIHDIFPPQKAEEFSGNIQQVLASGKPTTTETCLDTTQGQRWYEIIVRPIPEESDGEVGTVGIAHDITDRKLIEQERQHRSDELKSLLENIPDPISRYDRDTRCIYTNHAALEIAKRQGTTVLDKPLHDKSYPANVVRLFEDNIAAVFATGQQRRFEMTLPAGTSLEILLQPEYDAAARITSVLCIGHDLTAYRHLDEERLQHERQLREMLVETIHAMALTVEKRDPYTAGHQGRTASLAVAIGQELGLTAQQIEGLRLGGMIHDIGKIYIPAEILNRPGRISEPEMALIRTHPEVGYDIVKDIHFIWPVKEIVLQHHERINGTGYPHGLKGDEIALEARVVAVADVVEAISSHRPYRPALGIERGLDEIRTGRGTRYDSLVTDACLKLFAENRFSFQFD